MWRQITVCPPLCLTSLWMQGQYLIGRYLKIYGLKGLLYYNFFTDFNKSHRINLNKLNENEIHSSWNLYAPYTPHHIGLEVEKKHDKSK